MKKILVVFGTRPEAIKMAPLIRALRARKNDFAVEVCVTAQHRLMLDQVIDFFEVEVGHDLDLMKENNTLSDITANALFGVEKVIRSVGPDLVVVQGDTTTAFASALASYYARVPIAHVEAGLRSCNKYSPFPEEGNRVLIGQLADLHFVPTSAARDNLLREGITARIEIVGNTVIDALLLAAEIVRERPKQYCDRFGFLPVDSRVLLVTGHRRESFGKPFEEFCLALRDFAEANPHVSIVYPVHLNPNVRRPVDHILSGLENVYLIEPVEYSDLVYLLLRCYCVVTDSGGIQEEAPALGKPVVVTREVTERREPVEAGNSVLVGTDRKRIISELVRIFNDDETYKRMSQPLFPYGRGDASEKIASILASF